MNHARKHDSINLLKYHNKAFNYRLTGDRIRGPIVKNPDVLKERALM